jgi:putative solute:sodium symporter small subunit
LASVFNYLRKPDFWVALVIIVFIISFSALALFDTHLFNFSIGSLPFTHWASWIGGLWIAFVTPIYYVVKQRRPPAN